MRLLLACVLLVLGPLSGETIHFDQAKPGAALPPGWSVAMTHRGGAPKWQIVADSTAPSRPNVLAQTSSDKTDRRFPLAIFDRRFQDGQLSVMFKPMSGTGDQAGGLVWRYRDENDYYIVRANALENNVVLYKVEGGQRSALAPVGTPKSTYGVKHAVPSKAWSTLAVTFQGDLMTVSFNGQKLFDVKDSTFQGPGKIGLWTKADSVTYFDNFTIEER